MKTIRTEFHYPAATQCVPLSLSTARASCSLRATAFPLTTARAQSNSKRRGAPAHAGQLYWQIAAEQQLTEFLESVIFAALGASGLVGVAVSLL
jgi:hypothetical protein